MKSTPIVVALAALLVLGRVDCGDPWGENLQPRLRANFLSQKSDTVKNFLGNQTHNDHFKLLQSDGVSLLIGARNVVYNLSLATLEENTESRITWESEARERDLCLIKGKSEDECQNYIRVLAQTDPHNLLVCGTNSFNPKCRTYSTIDGKSKDVSESAEDDGSFKMQHEFSGRGFCPYDPKHNSTAIFTGGELYSGTVADFSGSDALIIRDNVRTEQYDLKHLNAPDFVSSMEDADHVYFFFRESAVEYINCGKAVFSRVARVCKNDSGGPHKFKNKWTSFLKSRLNCSVPGNMPFEFREIQSTASQMVDLGDGDKLVYGVFTTPDNAIAGSAVCSFRLSDIRHSFDEGPFKGQAGANANWLPVPNPPSPRPGSCAANSRELDDAGLNFIKRHSLMDRAVSNAGADPLLVRTSVKERMTVIAVDPRLRTPSGQTYDVIYVGTTRGKVIKFVSAIDINALNPVDTAKPVVIEEIQVFPYHVSVTNLQVVKVKEMDDEPRLIVLSNHEVKSLPLNRCNAVQVQTCSGCVALQDPYCAWNLQTNACVDHRFVDGDGLDASALVQDIFRGKHAACTSGFQGTFRPKPQDPSPAPPEERPEEAEGTSDATGTPAPQATQKKMYDELLDIDIVIQENDIPYYEDRAMSSAQSAAALYTGETLTIASVLICLFSIVIGFAVGFLVSRKIAKGDYNSCGHHYLETQRNLNKQNDTIHNHNESGYTAAPCNNALLNATTMTAADANASDMAKNSNLLVNVPTKEKDVDKDMKSSNVIGNGSVVNTSVVSSSANTGTIGRNGTLCKKVYL